MLENVSYVQLWFKFRVLSSASNYTLHRYVENVCVLICTISFEREDTIRCTLLGRTDNKNLLQLISNFSSSILHILLFILSKLNTIILVDCTNIIFRCPCCKETSISYLMLRWKIVCMFVSTSKPRNSDSFSFLSFSFCKQTIQHEILLKFVSFYVIFLFLLISTPDTRTQCRIQDSRSALPANILFRARVCCAW